MPLAMTLVVMSLVAGQAAGGAAAGTSPFVGGWTANIAKSRLSPANQFRGATLQIAAAGDVMTMSSVVVEASGQERHEAETFRTNGTETPARGNPALMLVASWVGSHVLATIAKKGDQVIALVTYEVSTDGKTLTARMSGMLEQVIVFERD